MAKSYMRQTKASKSTLRRIEIILRRDDYKKRSTVKN
jgi:hypothetical protein